MSTLFLCNYLTTHYSILKFFRNVLNRLILNIQEEKMMQFAYYEEYLTRVLNKIRLWQC